VIDANSTLEDVCFAASEALAAHGITAVLCGGSAAAVYAPHRYMSADADFILPADDALDDVAVALARIGFARVGRSRIFAHATSRFSIDFPKGPLAVGGDYVHETAVLRRGDATLRILTRTDSIRDRLAHFFHWNDYTALNAAVAVAAENPDDVDMNLVREWSKREGPEFSAKLHEFERRVSAREVR
jgi:hypothetical protein